MLEAEEDAAIDLAKSRVVWAYQHKGFMTVYRKALRRMRLLHHRNARTSYDNWKGYSRKCYDATETLCSTSVTLEYDNSMGTIGVTMPYQAAKEITECKFAALPLSKWMPRVCVTHGVPWIGWKYGGTPEMAVADLKDRIRTELIESGGWDDEDLLDHKMNVVRLVWLAAGYIYDNQNE